MGIDLERFKQNIYRGFTSTDYIISSVTFDTIHHCVNYSLNEITMWKH